MTRISWTITKCKLGLHRWGDWWRSSIHHGQHYRRCDRCSKTEYQRSSALPEKDRAYSR